ncbi:gustatory receptor for bitter taste 93a-like [Episyrphus balteatus]|uniref:gustatory receptor for bitter taste 93a-like n=1 Tax=Episyrphus balteatus TaxID=286459 RepID=UPI002486B9C5|nr:gustatory receptor for bitter taste 93a-like [Episyrphus balteatus]
MDSQKLFKCIYYSAKYLALTSITIDFKTNQIRKPTRWSTIIFIAIRIILLYSIIFFHKPLMGIPKLLELGHVLNFLQPVKHSSLTLAAVILCINWTLCDVQNATHRMLKQFFKVQQAIVKKIANSKILNTKKIQYLAISKFLLSFIDTLRDARSGFPELLAFDLKCFVFYAGCFLSLGATLLVEICFMGFLVIEVYYQQMNAHLRRLADRLKLLDKRQCSRHVQMKVLCEAADELDDSGIILSDIYRAAQSFFSICQSILFYSIFYNFFYILVEFRERFYENKNKGIFKWECLVDVLPNLVNLLLFIFCADKTVQRSRRIKLIEFDVICSGMDSRWDESVEMFLSRQNIEELHVKVFGLFELSKEFAMLLFSGGVTYLFCLIQLDNM